MAASQNALYKSRSKLALIIFDLVENVNAMDFASRW